MKNTVRECSQFIQNKEQNVNYSVLYRNYLFDTRRVIESSPENETPFYFISTTLFPFFPNFLQNFKFFLSFCEPLVFTYKAFKTYFQSSSKFLATTYPI